MNPGPKKRSGRRPPGRPGGHPRGLRNFSHKNSCQACRHPDVYRACFDILLGGKIAVVARKYGISEGSLRRHWNSPDHVSDRFKSQAAAFASFDEMVQKAAVSGSNCFDTAEALVRVQQACVTQAIDNGDQQLLGKASDRLLQANKHKAELTGLFFPAARGALNVNVLMGETVLDRFMTRLIDVVAPDAVSRPKVAELIREFGQQMRISDQRQPVTIDANDD